ncbi:hypothetical protein [Pseudomarimonas salicorniae]|uniref:Uncharacterized protein n=1 Tax=Pseudomarimonas salicorniae TaxID=2933270 RepID=A0ABT0GLN5_9GAMM|nr:hypothetical protein [Lysobacter sp. CAU 1642]MCK7595466.1 hypothetical protein [Lysobacter sp. CAU 1642]
MADYDLDPDNPPIQGEWFGLTVVYVWNDPNGFSFVSVEDAAELGVSEVQLREMSVNDLGLHAHGNLQFEPRGAIVGAFMGGDFEASFVLLDRLWDEMLRDRFPNGYAVAVPANDMLAFCDASSAEGVKELREVVSRTFDGGEDLLIPSIFSRVGGKWFVVP